MIENTRSKPKTINIVGPQGVGKTTIIELAEQQLSFGGISYSSINCTGYVSSPSPIRELGNITTYSISAMDKTGRIFPFLAIAGFNSSVLYNFAKHAAMKDDPDVILIIRNPYLDTYAMGEGTITTSLPKTLSRKFSKALAYDPPNLLIHLDAQPEVLYERVIKRIEEPLDKKRKKRPHPYETRASLEKIRYGYFDPVTEISNNGYTKTLQLDTSDLSIEEVFHQVWSDVRDLLEIEL